jgi:tight adherence protein B
MNGIPLRIVILVLVFFAVVLGVEQMLRLSAARRAERKGVNTRLDMIERGRTYAHSLTVLRRTVSSVPTGLPSAVDHWAHSLERRLQQAQIRVPTSTALLALVGVPVAIFALMLLMMTFWWDMQVTFGRLFLSAVMAYVLGAALPLLILNFKANARRKRVQEQFPVALDIFVRGLRAGHPVASALELLTLELPDPMGSEFGFVVDEVTYGAQLRDALQNLAERWDLDDMRMFVVSLSVQSDTGGNLAEILENLSRVVRDRQIILMKVRALSSEGRMTGLMLTLLPLFTLSALFLLNPSFYLDVAADSMFVPGFVGLILLYLTGLITIRRMVDLKV